VRSAAGRVPRATASFGTVSDPSGPLGGLHVLRIGAGIATAYCAKLLTDLGAHVVAVEPPGGDPLRAHRGGAPGIDDRVDESRTGPLFAYLHAGTRSVTDAAAVPGLLAGADLVVLGQDSPAIAPGVTAEALRASHPDLPVVSVTPFGTTGPLAAVAATEFTVEAWSGWIDARGYDGRPPVQQGGRLAEFIAGVYAAVGALAMVRAGGADIEVAWSEAIAGTLNHPTLYRDFTGAPAFTSRGLDYPSVERCKDGWVGLCIFTVQQWNDFASLIGRDDLVGDDRFTSMGARGKNRELAIETIQPWLDEHTAAEIVELGGLFRVPVAFIGNGRDLHTFDHLVEREVFVENPSGGFRQPRPVFNLSATPACAVGPVPAAGEADGSARLWAAPTRARRAADVTRRPLAGVRILDFTAFWAGPAATHLLRTLGAEVVKVEARKRPDGMRMATIAKVTDPDWLERGPTFHAVNPGKQSILVDMTTPEGRAVLLQLAAGVDGVIENFTPRVMQNAHLLYEDFAAVNPGIVMVRMPGFGLDGPWRDHSGFAQTMEQTSGMGWMCGYRDAKPIVRSTCDPIAGAHAALAFLAALDHRERTGEGQLVELPMVEVALQVTAEQTTTWSADGFLLERDGNRGPYAAPQGLYACQPHSQRGDEQWVAISVAEDAQWHTLVDVVDDARLRDGALATRAARHAQHDRIDDVLGEWTASRDRDDVVAALLAPGVPAAPVWNQSFIDEIAQFDARGYWQRVTHPVVGELQLPASGLWSSSFDLSYEASAPTLGQHTDDVLLAAGVAPDELRSLRERGIVG
jgi:crotonobetainyl-CoA:carnitine CoA-transferase CaiB-like acyl-CoA transferase